MDRALADDLGAALGCARELAREWLEEGVESYERSLSSGLPATSEPVASEAMRPPGVSPQAAAGGAQRAEGERSSSGRAAAQQGPSAQRGEAERSQSGRAAAQQGSNTQRAAGERSQKIARHRIERSLARVEQSILERESALEAIGWRMAEPSVHRDGERMRALEAERSALRAEVEALYKEWEGLAAELDDGPVA